MLSVECVSVYKLRAVRKGIISQSPSDILWSNKLPLYPALPGGGKTSKPGYLSSLNVIPASLFPVAERKAGSDEAAQEKTPLNFYTRTT